LHLVLLAAGLDNRVHFSTSLPARLAAGGAALRQTL